MHDQTEHRIAVPDNFRYNDDHIWMEYTETGFFKCGITEYLCELTGEIINIDFIRNVLNMEVDSADPVLSVESLNDSIIIKAPLPGVITEINQNCIDTPDLINNDPYGEGWLFIIFSDNISDFEIQMQHDEYEYLVMKEKENEDFV